MHRLRSRLFASPFTVGALPRQPYFFIAPHKPHDDVLSGAVAAWTDSHVRSRIRTLNLVRVGIGNVARSLGQALAFPAEHGVLNLQPIILSDRALRISFSVEPVNVAEEWRWQSLDVLRVGVQSSATSWRSPMPSSLATGAFDFKGVDSRYKCSHFVLMRHEPEQDGQVHVLGLLEQLRGDLRT